MASEETVHEKLSEMFKKSMLDKREMFLSSLQHAPQVAEELYKYKVFTENEKIAIISKPIRQHQKETLLYMLAEKKFENIDLIIEAFRVTENESLLARFKLFKIKVRSNYDPAIIKPLPRDNSSITCDGNDTVIDLTSLSELQEGDRDKIIPMSIRSCGVGDYSIPMEVNEPLLQCFTLTFEGKPEPSLNANREENVTDELEISDCFHQAASNSETEILELFLSLGKSPYDIHPKKGRTPLHAAVLGKCSKDAIKCCEILVKGYKEFLKSEGTENIEDIETGTLEFLNHQDEEGLTAVHLAADNESVEIVKLLYTLHCDIFIRSNAGLTPLEIMYVKTPEAIIHLLNEALPTTHNHESDGNLNLELDFRTIIGSATDKQSHDDENHQYSETRMLARLVHQNKAASKIILPHVIVKTFLDLKWDKMKFWLFMSMCVQICLHLWYTCFVVEVFLIKCPYSNHPRKVREAISIPTGNSTLDAGNKRNILSYLFGDWESVEQAFYIFSRTNKHQQACDLGPILKYQAIALLIIGILFFFKEFCEVLLVKCIFARGAGLSTGKWTNVFGGLKAYLLSAENIFQLIFISLMILVCTLAYRSNISDSYYSAAALSVVVAWALILMQVGNISGLGTYVQIFGKVIKRFATLMGTYLVLIIAFSIAFSIMFPREKPFETLPKAFSRVIIMMTGELNYAETFYNGEDSKGGPPIPLTGHIIYTCFTILLSIILINLLIGMVVSDVQKLRAKSEVILRSIQVEQLYVMEASLIRLRWIFLPFQKLIGRIKRKNPGNKETYYLDIFVINPIDISKSKGMVVNISIKEISKKLRKEIRTLAGGREGVKTG